MTSATTTTAHNQPSDGNDDDHNNRSYDHSSDTIMELEPGLRNHPIPERRVADPGKGIWPGSLH